MKKEWREPSISDLSVLNTEASLTQKPNHDGMMYDVTIHLPEQDVDAKLEGHS